MGFCQLSKEERKNLVVIIHQNLIQNLKEHKEDDLLKCFADKDT